MTRAKIYDVLIVGGGVIGLSIARSLRKRGITRIAVAERGEVGRESSYAAAGMLAPQAEADRADDFFRLCDASNRLYPEFADNLQAETGVDVEFDSTGTLYLAFTDEDEEEIGRRFRWQTQAGLELQALTRADVLADEPQVSTAVRAGLFFPNDRQVENRKLVAALKRFAELNRIEILERTEVQGLITTSQGVTGVETNAGPLFASTTVLATGAWTPFIKFRGSGLPISVKPMRGQMVCFRPSEKLFRHVVYSPRSYVVPRVDGRLLAGSTVEDVGFDKRNTLEGTTGIIKESRTIAPALGEITTCDRWAGLRPASRDGLPILGLMHEIRGLSIATGHFRNGILLAPITGEIIADQILGVQDSEYLTIFGAERFRKAASIS
jgi:glycine oxidase